MKCYFALSDDVSQNDNYYWMFVATINSAIKNTDLELHCLYDFRKTFVQNIEEDRIYKLLKDKNVKIHLSTIDFERELLSVYTDDYLKKINVTKSSLYSRFLRFMIADIENEDDVILYSDTDVLFMDEISVPNVKTIGVCPEFDKTDKYSYFNAGVMLINMASYKDAKKQLVSMLKEKKLCSIECCDQGYLNDIYKNKFEKLPLEFNWKPYWGENSNVKIVHLHGFKPNLSINGNENCYQEWISAILSKDKNSKAGCIHYFSEFVKYTQNKDLYIPVMTNLLCMLNCQCTENFTFINKLKRKVKKFFMRLK